MKKDVQKNWDLQSKNKPHFFYHHGEIIRKFICFSLPLHEKCLPQEFVTIGHPQVGLRIIFTLTTYVQDIQAKT